MFSPNILDRKHTALVIIDIQEAFRGVISNFDRLVSNTKIVLQAFQVFGLPIIITEQYPKGLGRTVPELLEVIPEDFSFVEKSTFSSCGSDTFLEQLQSKDITQILLCGLETHVCVNQTAHDLVNESFEVHILNDAVESRHEENKIIALNKMSKNGVTPSCVEMALFELLRNSNDEHFKAIHSLIK